MTIQDQIAIAESCGLVFNEFDESGEPEFIGTKEKFRMFEQVLMGEAQHESLTNLDEE